MYIDTIEMINFNRYLLGEREQKEINIMSTVFIIVIRNRDLKNVRGRIIQFENPDVGPQPF